jgi:hypothetical protein
MAGHLGAIVSLAFCPFARSSVCGSEVVLGGGGVTLSGGGGVTLSGGWGGGDGEARDIASGSGGEELLVYEALSY